MWVLLFVQAFITSTVGLDEAFHPVAPPAKHSVSVRLDHELLYAHVPPTFVGFVMSFYGSANTEKHRGFKSCS